MTKNYNQQWSDVNVMISSDLVDRDDQWDDQNIETTNNTSVDIGWPVSQTTGIGRVWDDEQ